MRHEKLVVVVLVAMAIVGSLWYTAWSRPSNPQTEATSAVQLVPTEDPSAAVTARSPVTSVGSSGKQIELSPSLPPRDRKVPQTERKPNIAQGKVKAQVVQKPRLELPTEVPALKPAEQETKASEAEAKQDTKDLRDWQEGQIEGLGAYRVAVGFDGKPRVELATADFSFKSLVDPEQMRKEFTLSDPANPQDALKLETASGKFIVSRNGKTVELNLSQETDLSFQQKMKEVRELLGPTAMAFRQSLRDYTSLRAPSTNPQEYLATMQALLDESTLSALSGDDQALTRAVRWLTQRVASPKLVNANYSNVQFKGCVASMSGFIRRVQFKDCVSDWERSLLGMNKNLGACVEAANRRVTVWRRVRERVLCHGEFTLSAAISPWQFAGCAALPK